MDQIKVNLGFGAAFDFGAFLSELTSVIQEAAAKAIAASPGTHININAVVTVIDTTPEDPVTIDGMLYEITCLSCFTLNWNQYFGKFVAIRITLSVAIFDIVMKKSFFTMLLILESIAKRQAPFCH